jgi:hypothetical protein
VNKYKMADGYYHQRTAPDDYAPSRLEYRKQLVVTLFEGFGAPIEAAPQRPARKRRAS